MTQLGIQIIPTMPVGEIVDTIVAAETLGYDYCMLADEGFMPDVYVVLGAAAQRTSRIRLGPVTNGYTRHPAVTANALATLDGISGGRALAVLVAGGSMVLNPMGIPRQAPLTVVSESIEMMRQLWSGEVVTWQGKRHSLHGAQLHGGARHTIPIWLAVRGDKMLLLAGQQADGVVLMAKPDVGPALALVAQGAVARTTPLTRVYLDRVAYTPAMLDEASVLYTYALLDTPQRMLDGLGIGEEDIQRIRTAMAAGGPVAAAAFVRPEMIHRYQIAGTREACRQALQTLIAEHRLDVFVMNIIAGGLEANGRLLKDIRAMVQGR